MLRLLFALTLVVSQAVTAAPETCESLFGSPITAVERATISVLLLKQISIETTLSKTLEQVEVYTTNQASSPNQISVGTLKARISQLADLHFHGRTLKTPDGQKITFDDLRKRVVDDTFNAYLAFAKTTGRRVKIGERFYEFKDDSSTLQRELNSYSAKVKAAGDYLTATPERMAYAKSIFDRVLMTKVRGFTHEHPPVTEAEPEAVANLDHVANPNSFVDDRAPLKQRIAALESVLAPEVVSHVETFVRENVLHGFGFALIADGTYTVAPAKTRQPIVQLFANANISTEDRRREMAEQVTGILDSVIETGYFNGMRFKSDGGRMETQFKTPLKIQSVITDWRGLKTRADSRELFKLLLAEHLVELAKSVRVSMGEKAPASDASAAVAIPLAQEKPALPLETSLTKIRELTQSEAKLPELIEALPQTEFIALEDLRARSIDIGLAAGLTKAEVILTLKSFISDGLIGGRPHAWALLDDESRAGYRKSGLEMAKWATREDLKTSFKPILDAQTSPGPFEILAREKVKAMVQVIVDGTTGTTPSFGYLKDSRKLSVLAFWYRATLTDMMRAAIQIAQPRWKRALVATPAEVANVNRFGWLVGGVTWLGGHGLAAFGGHLGLSADVLFDVGAATAGSSVVHGANMLLADTPLLRKYRNRDQTRLEKMDQAVATAARLASSKQALDPFKIEPLAPFNVADDYVALSIELRARLGKYQIEKDFSGSLAETAEIANEWSEDLRTADQLTAERQIERVKQIADSLNEFKLSVGQKEVRKDEASSKKLATMMSRYQLHLKALTEDLKYVVSQMEAHARELENLKSVAVDHSVAAHLEAEATRARALHGTLEIDMNAAFRSARAALLAAGKAMLPI